jgi:hypothetical protein
MENQMEINMTTFFKHTIDTAPQAARSDLEATQKTFGFVPNLQAYMAESPQLLKGYSTLWDLFAKTSLTTHEQQVVYMSSNFENECHY